MFERRRKRKEMLEFSDEMRVPLGYTKEDVSNLFLNKNMIIIQKVQMVYGIVLDHFIVKAKEYKWSKEKLLVAFPNDIITSIAYRGWKDRDKGGNLIGRLPCDDLKFIIIHELENYVEQREYEENNIITFKAKPKVIDETINSRYEIIDL